MAPAIDQSALGGNRWVVTPVMIALGEAREKQLLSAPMAQPLALSLHQIETIRRNAVPNGRLIDVQRLPRYDSYWYGTGDPRSDARQLWRPLRDALMWLLSAAGLAISVTGIVIGWR